MTTTERLREVEKEMPPAPLRTAECKTGANCWCRMVVGENGDEFIPAGFMRKTEAEFLVATRNALPAMLAVIEAAEAEIRSAREFRSRLQEYSLSYLDANGERSEDMERRLVGGYSKLKANTDAALAAFREVRE